jgi:hypothetical protein
MSELRTPTIFTDKASILVLQAIANLGNLAYGISIQSNILSVYDRYMPLDSIYEILIDLIEEGRVTSRKVDCCDAMTWRKVFSLVIPEGMKPWGPHEALHSGNSLTSPPIDWDNGEVFHLDGSVASHRNLSPPSFFHDMSADGTNIIGYTSMFALGSAGYTGESQDGESPQT